VGLHFHVTLLRCKNTGSARISDVVSTDFFGWH
jgi:hypothetical protein